MGVRHVHGGAFVPHVDDTDALPRHVVPDRLDMAALQAEDAIDAAAFRTAQSRRRRPFVGIQVWVIAISFKLGFLRQPSVR